jgi:hypothetical protein
MLLQDADACDDVYLIWNGRFTLSRGSIKQSVGEEGDEGAIEDRRQQKIVRSGDCFGDLSHVSAAFKRITGTVGVSQFDKQFLQTSTGQLPLCVWPMTATALEPSQVLLPSLIELQMATSGFSLPLRPGPDFAGGAVRCDGEPQASRGGDWQARRCSRFHLFFCDSGTCLMCKLEF